MTDAHAKLTATLTVTHEIKTPLKSWTLAELREAFKKVHNEDWRAPFATVIRSYDRDIVKAAVIWFVGESPEFETCGNSDFLVCRSVGYREGPCGS